MQKKLAQNHLETTTAMSNDNDAHPKLSPSRSNAYINYGH
jgi:hypothetical protein